MGALTLLETSETGKPGLVGSGVEKTAFNLSYSADVVAIAALAPGAHSPSSVIGFDIERIPQAPAERIPWEVLPPGEIELLAELRPDMQYADFLQIWTIKEAFVKAIGEGVGFGLQNIEVSLQPTAIFSRKIRRDTLVAVQQNCLTMDRYHYSRCAQ